MSAPRWHAEILYRHRDTGRERNAVCDCDSIAQLANVADEIEPPSWYIARIIVTRMRQPDGSPRC